MIKITTIQEIHALAVDKKSLCDATRKGHIPASFMINMSGMTILQHVNRGLYQYVMGCTCQTPGDICPKCFEQIKPIEF